MGYADISNLYKDQDILLYKECYSMEKLHGTSAAVHWRDGKLSFFSGGEKHENFVALFDQEALAKEFLAEFGPCPDNTVTVYGEAYGGRQQGMSKVYGPNLKFCAFEINDGHEWFDVPRANAIARKLGLEFVHWKRIPATLEAIDAERDADSVQAVRNGMGPGKMREGVVLRPIVEMFRASGERIISKHKRDEFSEHARPPKVVDPAKIEVLKEAQAIAEQWATEGRLAHVLDGLPDAKGMEHTSDVIRAMIADIQKESKGEIVWSKDAMTAIGRRTAEIWKRRVQTMGTP